MPNNVIFFGSQFIRTANMQWKMDIMDPIYTCHLTVVPTSLLDVIIPLLEEAGR